MNEIFFFLLYHFSILYSISNYILDYTFSMGAIKTILENHLPGVHVHSLMIGKSPNEDTLNGFFMSVNHQMEIACDLIKNDPLLQDG